jgi:hypothetical protein
MTRRREKPPAPGGHAEERRRQFERGRGLAKGRDLDLGRDEEKAGKDAEEPPPDQGKEPRRDQGA